MTKQEFDKQLKNGVSAPLCQEIGAWSCDFRPFEKREYKIGSIDIDRLNNEQLSTVYRGIRFYFETPEQLNAFCEMIEDIPTVERTQQLQDAVDLAVDALKEIKDGKIPVSLGIGMDINDALEQITALTKGGDNE